MDHSQQEHAIVVTPELFWHAINILVTKPHVVNKRLWGCKLLGRYTCTGFKNAWKITTLPVKLENSDSIDSFLSGLISSMGIELAPNENSVVESEILLLELLPKSYKERHAFQLVLLQRKDSTATFYDVSVTEHNQKLCPNFTYRFHLLDDTVRLVADAEETSKPYIWLSTTVLPQVNKWSQEAINNINQPVNKSLALVPHDLYYVKYNDLKEKYGKDLVKNWPECTDPSKYVYEDIAIATYLLLLWEEKHDECVTATAKSFVDIGCGNGLLVYILTMEGHNGYGIDVRKRRIWDMYPENIKLLEMTVTPSNIHMFHEVDWIIGNHSDELTPWIPVIAATSSYKCKFFLLPCCAYNFDGTKYQRQNSSKSQYTEYLDYIQKLSEDCGFEIFIDRLKIPSTKRICFVGKKRTHEQEEFSKYCDSIDNLVKTDESTSTDKFKARTVTEKVRNCTRVDRKVVDSIISRVADLLLREFKNNYDALDRPWSPGKTADITEIVSVLSPNTLRVLKSECGGIQTLLKNNQHIFRVRNGKVQLQYPRSIEEMRKNTNYKKRYKLKLKIKVKECWFHKNHPQGCPLQDMECSFLH